jgi:hypothetical protein
MKAFTPVQRRAREKEKMNSAIGISAKGVRRSLAGAFETFTGVSIAASLIRTILCMAGFHKFQFPGGRCVHCPAIDRSFEKETKWRARRRARN